MEKLQTISEQLDRIEALLISHKIVLTFDEVAKYTGLSKSYLYKLSANHGIPCYKPNGKNVFFRKTEIDDWLLRNRKLTREEIEEKAGAFRLKKSA